MNHRIDAAPDTVHWGYFDAALPPVLTVDSGETVTISTVFGISGTCSLTPAVRSTSTVPRSKDSAKISRATRQ